NADFDAQGYYVALKEVADLRLPVVNMSFGFLTLDQTSDLLFQNCINSGVVLVAAAGPHANDRSPPVFPADHPAVISVGALTDRDQRSPESNVGGNLWISAPGQNIWTVFGPTQCRAQGGSSFSSAMVSAAVWLA